MNYNTSSLLSYAYTTKLSSPVSSNQQPSLLYVCKVSRMQQQQCAHASQKLCNQKSSSPASHHPSPNHKLTTFLQQESTRKRLFKVCTSTTIQRLPVPDQQPRRRPKHSSYPHHQSGSPDRPCPAQTQSQSHHPAQ